MGTQSDLVRRIRARLVEGQLTCLLVRARNSPLFGLLIGGFVVSSPPRFLGRSQIRMWSHRTDDKSRVTPGTTGGPGRVTSTNFGARESVREL